MMKKNSSEVDELTLEFNMARIFFAEEEEEEEEPSIVVSLRDITERRKAEEALRESEEKYRTILENIEEGYYEVDIKGNFTFVNDSMCKILGYSSDELIGMNYRQYTNEKNAEKVYQGFNRVFKTGIPSKVFDWELIRKDGTERFGEVSASLIRDSEGHRIGFRGIIRDVTERKQVEEELKESEERYRSLVESTEDSVYLVDRDCRYLFINNKHISRLGLAKDQVIGRTYNELHSKEETEEFVKAVEEIFETGSSIQQEHKSHRSNRYYLRTLSPIKDSKGSISAVTVVSKDVTERKRAEEEIRYISFHDALTGLYNRAYFKEEIRRINTKRNYPITIVMADINGLKLVNDTFGHDKGDELIKNTAKILKSVSREEDVVARIGGDEFAIILPHCDENVAQAFCNRFEEACKKYNSKSQLNLSATLGYAVQWGQYKDMDSVLKQADENMYTEKQSDDASNERHIVDALKTVLAVRDPHTEKHAERLQDLSEAIGKNIGLSELKLRRLRLLALLHDLGKISTPDNILFKPNKLTKEEWEIMKKHAEEGYKIAKSSLQLFFIAEDILHHHERWDGRGYPKGLKGEEIPILSRIMSIVDAYDMMLTERPYKKAMTKEEAIQELKENAGTQFDPELVKKFLKIIEKKD